MYMNVLKYAKPSLLLLLWLSILPAFSQSILDEYLEEGLQNNLLLQQRHLSLEQSLLALKMANTYFLPSVSLGGSYTHGEGGRNIQIPIGDLLNPVYRTLNEMTQADAFPQVENVSQNFFPSHFVDGRVRTSLPILNTDLYYNRRIKEQQVQMQEQEVKVYQRSLVRDIKKAYYAYLSASEAVMIYESALELVEENLRVNESLLRNGKGLPAYVLRAESELENVKVQLQEASNQQLNAQRYFNFLLNRGPLSPVIRDTSLTALADDFIKLSDASDLSRREELLMLQTAEHINQTLVRMQQQYWTPKLNAFVDLGAQAENMNWNSQSPYLLMGLTLDIPLYQGGRNRQQIRHSQLEVSKSRLGLQHTRQQLKMASDMAADALQTAQQQQQAARKRLDAAQKYFRLIARGYAEGTNSLIEQLDARNQLTAAQLQWNISRYALLSSAADYERETAAYPLN
jgi:outer membrane protein TolC